MYYKFFLIWAILFLTSVGLIAQNETEDIIYLDNGEIIKGQVLEYDPKTNIKIEILGGSILVYKSSKVTKLEKGPRTNVPKTISSDESNKVKEKGVYHSIMGGTIFGLSGGSGVIGSFGPSIGFSVNYAIGYHFHRLFGAGIQIGVMVPTWEFFVPICANFRGYIMKKGPSLYYDVNIGYGLTLSGIGWDGARKGGLHLRPSVGVCFPSTKKGKMTMDLGYMIQFGGVHEYVTYGISLRAGATF